MLEVSHGDIREQYYLNTEDKYLVSGFTPGLFKQAQKSEIYPKQKLQGKDFGMMHVSEIFTDRSIPVVCANGSRTHSYFANSCQ